MIGPRVILNFTIPTPLLGVYARIQYSVQYAYEELREGTVWVVPGCWELVIVMMHELVTVQYCTEGGQLIPYPLYLASVLWRYKSTHKHAYSVQSNCEGCTESTVPPLYLNLLYCALVPRTILDCDWTPIGRTPPIPCAITVPKHMKQIPRNLTKAVTSSKLANSATICHGEFVLRIGSSDPRTNPALSPQIKKSASVGAAY